MSYINKKVLGKVLVIVPSNPIDFVESPEMDELRKDYLGFLIEVITEEQLPEYLKEE
jgi:hypothetical protein